MKLGQKQENCQKKKKCKFEKIAKSNPTIFKRCPKTEEIILTFKLKFTRNN